MLNHVLPSLITHHEPPLPASAAPPADAADLAALGSARAARRRAVGPALLPAIERLERGLERLESLEQALGDSMPPEPDWEELVREVDRFNVLAARGSTSRRAVVLYLLTTALIIAAILAGTQTVGILAWPETSSPTGVDDDRIAVVLDTARPERPWYPPHDANSPTGSLSDEGFLRMVALILCATVCITGLGMEVVLGEPLVKFLSSTQSHILWKGAQLAFSLFISVALFARSFSTLPFAVLGFWKMGFPETAGCFRRAFGAGKVNAFSVCAYLNGLGTTIHHTSGAYLICACTVELMPLDRRVLSMALPLVVQHLVVLLKYWSVPAYGLSEFCLEVWFEWEVFANLDALSVGAGYDMTTRGICLSMLVAHWFYWIAAVLNLPAFSSGKDSALPSEAQGEPTPSEGQPSCAPLSPSKRKPTRSLTPERWKLELNRRSASQSRLEQLEQMAADARFELRRGASRAEAAFQRTRVEAEAAYQARKASAEAVYQSRKASAKAAFMYGREQVAAKAEDARAVANAAEARASATVGAVRRRVREQASTMATSGAEALTKAAMLARATAVAAKEEATKAEARAAAAEYAAGMPCASREDSSGKWSPIPGGPPLAARRRVGGGAAGAGRHEEGGRSNSPPPGAVRSKLTVRRKPAATAGRGTRARPELVERPAGGGSASCSADNLEVPLARPVPAATASPVTPVSPVSPNQQSEA
ncbi:hypothetical protein AB1Y20_005741 [Prymnesium parvum]|uniref:Uncharacterized protein n=1 Tax=Prymnesium parvum TaxID=97485 RepID=A0AB34J0M0_PRYPA